MILLYNKETVLRTLWNFSAGAYGVAATVANTALYKCAIWFLIQLDMFIIGLLLEYFWFLDNFVTFIYLCKPTPRELVYKSEENFPYSLLLCSVLPCILSPATIILRDVFDSPFLEAILTFCPGTWDRKVSWMCWIYVQILNIVMLSSMYWFYTEGLKFATYVRNINYLSKRSSWVLKQHFLMKMHHCPKTL